MRWSIDEYGITWLNIQEINVTFSALPLLKRQFERLWCRHPGLMTNQRYADVLALNPRNDATLECAILTGISLMEAQQIVGEIGNASLPNEQQWMEVYQFLKRQNIDNPLDVISQISNDCLTRDILNTLFHERNIGNFAQLTLMEHGILEWTSQNTLMGMPRQEWFPNLWEPMIPIIPFDINQGLFLTGMRLFR